jgi:hypothetical protein
VESLGSEEADGGGLLSSITLSIRRWAWSRASWQVRTEFHAALVFLQRFLERQVAGLHAGDEPFQGVHGRFKTGWGFGRRGRHVPGRCWEMGEGTESRDHLERFAELTARFEVDNGLDRV